MNTLRIGPFDLRDRRIVVHGSPSITEWRRAVRFAGHVERNAQFWLGDLLNYGQRAYGEKYSPAVAALRLPRQTLENYAYVARNVQFSRRRENLPFSVHAEVAALAPKDQDRWLTRAVRDDLSVADLRVALRIAQREVTYSAGPLPAGQFRIVYADPPWSYGNEGLHMYGAAERHYPTMSVEHIAAVPVREHIERDAVLFLWVPEPHLFTAKTVIDAWGFEHKTGIVWDKQRHVYGHYLSVRHEHLLICTPGRCTPDRPVPMPPSVVTVRSRRHSEKPAEFRALIDRLYPFGQRVELFARGAVPAPWVSWGNQAARSAA